MYTILVVDDDAVCRDMVCGLLNARGYETACAADGAEALKFLDARRPDLVLLDAEMPGVGGHAFLQTIRRDARFRLLPVIVLSGLSSREFVQGIFKLGVQGYLIKSSSLSAQDLIARVNRCLAPDPTARAG